MGYNAVQALEKQEDAKAILVVFIGAGHVQYGLGAERQARNVFRESMASLIPVPVSDEKRGPVTAVNAAYANFIWGVAAEADPLYPSLGVSTRPGEGGAPLQVIDVEKDSPGAKAGVAVRDVLVSLDGLPVKDRETLSRLMAEKNWGDAAKLVVRRDGKDTALTVLFRREPRAPATPAPSASRESP
jgi:S1-C subfamily serine protease